MLRWLVIALVALVSPALAAPSFAVELRAKDSRADAITQRLLGALRATRTYRHTTTRKQLVAAIDPECPIIETSCAAAVGATLGVDYMFVGTVESRGAAQIIVELNVINVQTKKRVRSTRDVRPRTTPPARWAKQLVARLVDDVTGELQLRCNCQRAVVLVDGQRVTEVFERRATVTGLALGRHALELRAPGFRPYTGEVTVDGTTTLSVAMEPE